MVKEATVRKSGDNLYVARDVPFQVRGGIDNISLLNN